MKTLAVSIGIISLIAGMLFAILLLLLYAENPTSSFESVASIKIENNSPLTQNSNWPTKIAQQPPHWSDPHSYRLHISGTRGSEDVIVFRVESAEPEQAQGLADFMASRFDTTPQSAESSTEKPKSASDPSIFTRSTFLFWVQLLVCLLTVSSGVLLLILSLKRAKA